jgi:hypothetical protein
MRLPTLRPCAEAMRLSSTPAGLLAFGSSDRSRLLLVARVSFHAIREWHHATIVPDYSGGTAMDFHHLPFCLPTQETGIERYSVVNLFVMNPFGNFCR